MNKLSAGCRALQNWVSLIVFCLPGFSRGLCWYTQLRRQVMKTDIIHGTFKECWCLRTLKGHSKVPFKRFLLVSELCFISGCRMHYNGLEVTFRVMGLLLMMMMMMMVTTTTRTMIVTTTTIVTTTMMMTMTMASLIPKNHRLPVARVISSMLWNPASCI